MSSSVLLLDTVLYTRLPVRHSYKLHVGLCVCCVPFPRYSELFVECRYFSVTRVFGVSSLEVHFVIRVLESSYKLLHGVVAIEHRLDTDGPTLPYMHTAL